MKRSTLKPTITPSTIAGRAISKFCHTLGVKCWLAACPATTMALFSLYTRSICSPLD